MNKSDIVITEKGGEVYLEIRHALGGFGSCGTVALLDIIDCFNKYKRLPIVDRSAQYTYYDENLIDTLFCVNDSEIEFTKDIKLSDRWQIQWEHYENLPFPALRPFVDKYFSPSNQVALIRDMFLDKYEIDLSNTVSVFYRGNDKQQETKTASYDSFIDKCKEIRERRPDVRFLIQPDETEFLETFIDVFPDTTHIVENKHIKKNEEIAVFHSIHKRRKAKHVINFFASLLVHSMCSEIVTGSGNIGLWLALYRGHTNGLHQIYNDKWYGNN